jgi:hypothetical protein
MARQARIDVPLSSEHRRALDVKAAAIGVKPTTAGRMAILEFVGRHGLVLTGQRVTGQRDIDAFIAELKGDARMVGTADTLAAVLKGLDGDADTSSDACGLFDCLAVIARCGGTLERRLRAMLELCDFSGTVAIPRALFHPNRTTTS